MWINSERWMGDWGELLDEELNQKVGPCPSLLLFIDRTNGVLEGLDGWTEWSGPS